MMADWLVKERCTESSKLLICQIPAEESPMALYGDTSGSLTDHQIGGDQTLTLDAHIDGTAYGDADEMTDHAQGGNDMLTGGFEATNYLFGDANDMSDNSLGGNDILWGGSGLTNRATNFLYGDGCLATLAAATTGCAGGAIILSISSTAMPTPCPTTPAVAMTR